MARLKHYINERLVNEPLEHKSLELELNFDDTDQVEASITQDRLTFVNINADTFNDYLQDTTGAGVFYGIPYRIEVSGRDLFKGYVDLTDGAEFSCEKVKVKIREKEKIDWLEKVGDGFGFDLLKANGLINNADYVRVPYILSEIPDYKQAALFFLYAFVLEREIEGLFQRGKDILADLSGFFSTIAGVLKLIFYLAHLIATVAAIIVLVKNMIEELISPVRFHYGMLVKKHFEAACVHLGLAFSSSLFDVTVPTHNELASGLWTNLTLVPEKRKAGFKKNKATSQEGYFEGTFGDFVRGLMEVFNAKIRILNGTLHFERRDWSVSTATYKIPNVRRDFHGINADKMVSNYLVQFQIDSLDLNTVNRYNGTNAKNYTEHLSVYPKLVSLIHGFRQPAIPFALGRRKDDLTRVEVLVNGLFKVIDILLTPLLLVATALIAIVSGVVKAINAIISAINVLLSKGKKIKKIKVPSTKNLTKGVLPSLGDRIGMMHLSSDFIGVAKLILTTGSGWDVKIATDNDTKLTAENLWNWYHCIESMVPTATRPNGNQAYIYDIPVIPFCEEDFDLIRGTNNQNEGEAKVISPEGNEAKILSLKWVPYANKASIRYEENKLYTDNLKQTLLINEGQ